MEPKATPRPYRPAVYVQRRGNGYLETVDEFETRKEARAMLAEYQMSDPAGTYYLSRRPCRDWATRSA
jgi:hypothetical protein